MASIVVAYKKKRWGERTSDIDEKWRFLLKQAKSGFSKNWDAFKNATHDNMRSIASERGGALYRAIAFHYCMHASSKNLDRAIARYLDKFVFSNPAARHLGSIFEFQQDELHDAPPLNAPMSYPPYKTEQQINEILTANIDHSIWLDPHNHTTLPLEGREKQKEALSDFMEQSKNFRIQPVIGPSGAGKTRLVSEWMRTYVATVNPETNWEAGFLISNGNENARDPQPWLKWKIKKNTLIVIDYTYAFDEVVRAVAKTSCAQSTYDVRLIVVDHVMPKVLQNDFFWGELTGGHKSSLDSFTHNYVAPTIELFPEADNSHLLHHVIKTSANIGKVQYSEESPVIVDALTQLDRIGREEGGADFVRYPLFAALMGQIIRVAPEGGIDFSAWKRRDLIIYYFDGKDRLPWMGWENELDRGIQKRKRIEGLYAGAIVSAATLCRSLSVLDIEGHLPHNHRRILQIARRIVSSDESNFIDPLLPDIFGETFVLKFLESVNEHPGVFEKYITILSETSLGDAKTRAVNIRETIARLIRNLANDDPARDDVIYCWQTILRFVDPKCGSLRRASA